jgi:amidase
MPDSHFASATALLGLLRTGQLSSRALLEQCLAREVLTRESVNAVVMCDVDGARAAADRADALRGRGEPLPPLHGLPMTLKDSFEVAGMRTTSGAAAYAEHTPDVDAVVAARLRAAGAIIFGKTNVSTLCADVQCFNALFGTTSNPYDLTRTAGGSSGGAAAALAVGITPLEVGGDLAGSIRTPAGFCGVYGHKASYGLIPQRGMIPGPPGQRFEADLVALGPMARTAEDLALLLPLLAGPVAPWSAAYHLRLPAPRHRELRHFRVATWFHDDAAPIQSGVLTRLEATAEALRRAGAHVVEARLPCDMERVLALYRPLLDSVATLGVPAASLEAMARKDGPVRTWAEHALMRHRDYLALHEARLALAETMQAFFAEWDVILCPITPVSAFPHDQRPRLAERALDVDGVKRPYTDLFSWIALATSLGLPATAAPIGRDAQGLPVGLQIIGPAYEDLTPITFAAELARLVGGFEPPVL